MKKIYRVQWSIGQADQNDSFEYLKKEVYKATKESAVLTAQNIKSAFEDLGYKKEQIPVITIEEVELT